MSEIELLDSDDGFDLDNDGTPDNGLALLFEDPYIGPALGGDPMNTLPKVFEEQSCCFCWTFVTSRGIRTMHAVDIDIFLGHDPDGDKDNTLDGEEFTVTCSSLTEGNTADSQVFRCSNPRWKSVWRERFISIFGELFQYRSLTSRCEDYGYV